MVRRVDALLDQRLCLDAIVTSLGQCETPPRPPGSNLIRRFTSWHPSVVADRKDTFPRHVAFMQIKAVTPRLHRAGFDFQIHKPLPSDNL